jgi:hypothetical protein
MTLLTPAEILPASLQALSILFFLLSLQLFLFFFHDSIGLSFLYLQLSFKLLLDFISHLFSNQSSSPPRRPPSRPPLFGNRLRDLFALLCGTTLIVIITPTIITECLIIS